MNLALWLACLAIIVGASLWLAPVWQRRQQLAVGYICLELLVFTGFAASGHPMLLILFSSVAVYKIVNIARVQTNRIQASYLKSLSWRCQYLLMAVQLVIIIFAAVHTALGLGILLAVLAAAGLLLNSVLLVSTSRHLQTTKTLQASVNYKDSDLPTLSVLVPARDETTELAACLQCLVASDYPKLEILVLDDCSENKLPTVRGVRYVSGQVSDDSWLAKNYAYQQLADASTGDYLLFCGVDIRMSPAALRELVTTMLEKKKTMLSILPTNTFPTSWRSRLIQPMRYAWELCLPRKTFNRPPVLSTCWLITRQALQSSGSFKATSRSILPESYFARMTAHVDGYSFLRSNMLVSDKSPLQQQATTIRMRYPQLRRRVELVWFITLLEIIGLLLPLPVMIALLVLGHPLVALIALAALLIQFVVSLQVTAVMYGRPLIHTTALAPLYDIILLNYSMYRYEFKQVTWKGRDVCPPVMRIGSESAPKTSNPG